MIQEQHVFSLPEEISFAELKAQFEKHIRVRESPARTVNRTFLDTFDWRVSAKGGALEERSENGMHTLGWRDRSGALYGTLRTDYVPRFAWDMPAGALRRRLQSVLEMRALMPQVKVRSSYQTLNLLNEDDKTVVRAELERNEVCDAKGETATALGKRLVIAPLRGYEKPLKHVVDLVEGELGLMPCDDTLLRDALEAVGRRVGDYSAKLNVPLDRRMSAAEALRKILIHLLNTVEVNESGVHADIDSEFLHDFRVAVRRTRSALGQIKGVLPESVLVKFAPEFAWLGGVTGPTRDLDVYLLKFDGYKASLPASMRPALEPLHEFLHAHKAKEHRILSTALDSSRYRKLVAQWRAYLESPVQEDASAPNASHPVLEVADERIMRVYHRVVKKGRKITPKSPADDLHRLRIACKKLRYLMEFFHTLYPQSRIRALIKALKVIQDNLGDFNDLSVQMNSLRTFGRQMLEEGNVPVETYMAMGVLVERLEERQQQIRREFEDRFASFAAPDNDALFRELFTAPAAAAPA